MVENNRDRGGYSRGWDDVSDIRPSWVTTPAVSAETERLAGLIGVDPIAAFTQMASKVRSLPSRMFVNTASVDLSLGDVKQGEALGSFTLKVRVHSDSLAELVDFAGDLPEAVALAKRLKKGIFNADVRVVYHRASVPLGIELGWESFDRIGHRGHIEAGKKAMSKNLFAALFTLMQPNDPNLKPEKPERRNYPRASQEPTEDEERDYGYSESQGEIKPAPTVEPIQPVSSWRPTQPSETAKKRWEKKQQRSTQQTSQASKKDKAMEKRRRRAKKKAADLTTKTEPDKIDSTI